VTALATEGAFGAEEELRAALALGRVPGLGPQRYAMLMERFGYAAEALRQGAPLLPARVAAGLRNPDWGGVDSDLAWRDASQGRVILLRGEAGYPPLLASIDSAPPLLFVQGRLALLAEPQLAIVGSRSASALGGETAFAFARHLSAAGLAITSGLALGIDAAAHRGALAGGGGTIAVLGTGPDRVYPARHRELAHAVVAQGGALVSEFHPGTGVRAEHFPRRNRIISGLALGTLVVEAAPHSGSLITARLAAEQGREVFAIPGSIHNPLARGCHRLIKEGAKLVETATDILEELAPHLLPLLAALPPLAAEERAESPLPMEARQLLEALGHAPASVDQLTQRCGLTADNVSSILLSLELEGYVTSAGGQYVRTGKRAADETERV